MKFIIFNVDNVDGKPCKNAASEVINEEELFTVEINSLDELMNLIKEVDNPLIISDQSCFDDNTPEIVIYDGDIE